jgi:RNA polymerase sigma factor (sigma-70 family)
MQRFEPPGCPPINTMTDPGKLVKDCIRKKPGAQRALYELFAPSMLGLCYRYTKSVADAEDVLQEGFIKVFTYLDDYRFEGELGGWIRTIMVHSALNFLKSNRRYQYDLSFGDSVMHPVSLEDPSVILEAKELSELIRQLPTGFQTIFNLHAVEGFTHVEIAAMLGIHEGTSRSQYARARTLLIEWIGKFSSKAEPEKYGRK